MTHPLPGTGDVMVGIDQLERLDTQLKDRVEDFCYVRCSGSARGSRGLKRVRWTGDEFRLYAPVREIPMLRPSV